MTGRTGSAEPDTVTDTLADAVEDYLAIRRALGLQLLADGKLLARFARFAAARGESTVTIDAAVAWSALGSSTADVARRLSMVRRFAIFLAAFDPATQVPPERMVASGVTRRAPYIFDAYEITDLIAAAATLSSPPPAPSPPLLAVSFATLIGLMAATGIRTSEVTRLDRSDVDLNAGLLLIRYSKYGKSRRIPLHPSTVTALADYGRQRDDLCPRPLDDALLIVADGERLRGKHTGPTFHRLLSEVGITVAPGRRPPRLHDLRHTFAVTTLIGWHRQGLDVTARLPLLSLYLGHVNPAHTYWYLQAVPELMSVLADRLEDHLNSEPGH
jgi:integrase